MTHSHDKPQKEFFDFITRIAPQESEARLGEALRQAARKQRKDSVSNAPLPVTHDQVIELRIRQWMLEQERLRQRDAEHARNKILEKDNKTPPPKP